MQRTLVMADLPLIEFFVSWFLWMRKGNAASDRNRLSLAAQERQWLRCGSPREYQRERSHRLHRAERSEGITPASPPAGASVLAGGFLHPKSWLEGLPLFVYLSKSR